MIIIGIDGIDIDLFMVTTIFYCDATSVHIDEHLVTADIKKYNLTCENYEVQ